MVQVPHRLVNFHHLLERAKRLKAPECKVALDFGQQLISKALEECQRLWADTDIQIGAQVYLEKVYQQFGFVRHSEDYLEDGIPHVDMVLSKGR